MRREPGFPSMLQAAWLLLASFLLQYLIAVALHDFRGFLKLTPAQSALYELLEAHVPEPKGVR